MIILLFAIIDNGNKRGRGGLRAVDIYHRFKETPNSIKKVAENQIIQRAKEI